LFYTVLLIQPFGCKNPINDDDDDDDEQVVAAGFNSVLGVMIMVMAYCNIVFNPWIYMSKYDVVKLPLARLTKYNKVGNQQPPAAT